MNRFASIRRCGLGLVAALLIMTQSLLAVGMAASYTAAEDNTPEKTEVSQKVVANVGDADIAARVTLTTFLFYWIAKTFAVVDEPIIRYRNCQALFVNPASFNVYYTCLSALAP